MYKFRMFPSSFFHKRYDPIGQVNLIDSRCVLLH